MNPIFDNNQTAFVMMDTLSTDKLTIGTDFEPIPFCSVITPSNDQVKNEILPTKMMTMIRIPCRARGVCDTHTPSSAYFEIPEDCLHGKLLECSHKLCRDSGRRFRYCKMCDQVTAKRNFTKRHAHGVNMRLSPISVARIDSTSSSSNGSTSCKRRKVSIDAETNAEASLIDLFVNAVAEGDDDGISNISKSIPSTVYAQNVANREPSDRKLMMVTRREAGLLELVRNRPSESDAMSTERWIQEILDITKNDTHQTMMEDDILTDDEGELLAQEPPMRQQSLDRFDIFTESFENLLMK